MSTSLVEFLKRMSSDMSFKSLAQTQPELALAGYSMSSEEQSALKQLLNMTSDERKNYMKITPDLMFWQ